MIYIRFVPCGSDIYRSISLVPRRIGPSAVVQVGFVHGDTQC